MRTVSLLLLVFVLLASCARATPTPAPTPAPIATPSPTPVELKWSTWAPPVHYLVKEVYEPWAKQVERETGGGIRIVIYAGGALGKPADHYDMIRTGITDTGMWYPGYTPGRFPLSTIVELPFAAPTAVIGTELLWDIYKKGFLNEELKDIKVLWLWGSTSYDIHTTKKKVTTLEDMKGLKLGTPGGLITPALTALGAIPISLSTPEFYAALQSGVIDGVSFGMAQAVGFKLQELVKYVTIVGMGVTGLGAGMTPAVWDKLHPDYKAVMEKAGEWARLETARSYDRNEEAAEKTYGNAGIPIYTLPAAERARWIAATQSVTDSYVADMDKKGLRGTELYKAFTALLEKYR